MYISLIRAKLHQARITGAEPDYVGSIAIDSDLLAQACIYPYEKVLVADIDNGARLETYTIPAPAGSRIIEMNGAAARLIHTGDRVIIMAFALVEPPPPPDWEPRVLVLDEYNQVRQTLGPVAGC
jgi:aspartate 1-decarboxylase